MYIIKLQVTRFISFRKRTLVVGVVSREVGLVSPVMLGAVGQTVKHPSTVNLSAELVEHVSYICTGQ